MVPLGGCVHVTPLLSGLHAAQNLPIYVATRGIGLQVFRHDPNLYGVFETLDPLTGLPAAVRSLRHQLTTRKLRPRWVLLDAGNQRSRIALLAIATGAPLVGYSQAPELLTTLLRRDSARSMIQENLEIAHAIGVPAVPAEPRVYASAEEVSKTFRLLDEANPSHLPVAVFATQGSGGQPTEWHPDRFAAVIQSVSQRGMLPVFVGAPNQAEAIDRLRALAGVPTASLAGKTDIGMLAALMAQADLVIAIDSGPMHIARGSGVPLVVLAPTYQSPVEWLPLHLPSARVLRGEGIHPAPPGYRLDEIEVAAVEAAIDDLLRIFPPNRAAREARLARSTSAVDHLRN